MLRIHFDDMIKEFTRVLIKAGFTNDRAELCAKIFAETSRDGVYTHGINRFARFVQTIRKGNIDVNAVPEKVASFGALERWDGHLGPGNLNAYVCMQRAVDIAKEHGIGCVALRNTNHWMRPGAYGILAADNNCIGICWSNTVPIMPPWGGNENKLGNNPIVFAVPRQGGHIILDMALSLYSYGKMETYARQNEPLPFDAGWDSQGNITRDAQAILDAKRPFPIGYWKGSGFALVLDLITMILSGGKSTYEIGLLEKETCISQTFIAINYQSLPDNNLVLKSINDVLDDMHSASLQNGSNGIFYPGERMMHTRKENMEKGIPVEDIFWKQVLDL